MSSTTKKKFVKDEVLNYYEPPSKDQQIVKVLRSPGNNLHEVTTSSGEKFLASMPVKFRKHIWIKRGDFVVVDPIAEGVKVKAEIVHILLKDQIKYLKSIGAWPEEFNNEKQCKQDDDSPSDNDEDGLFVNRNRKTVYLCSSSEDDSSTADDGEESDEESEVDGDT